MNRTEEIKNRIDNIQESEIFTTKVSKTDLYWLIERSERLEKVEEAIEQKKKPTV